MTPSEIADAIDRIRERVRRNEPRHRNPDAFHEEKSEITGDLTKLAKAVRANGRTGKE